MSLSGIGRQRRSLKQTPWIKEAILTKRGKRKQRPQTVDVLKHLHKLSDGSLVKEVADGEVYITAVFSNEGVQALLEEQESCSQPNWDHALLLVTKYHTEFLPRDTLTNSYYVLHINKFKIWDLHEGFERKGILTYCMNDNEVKEKASGHWNELQQEMLNNTNNQSMELSQLLEEMAKDDSQLAVPVVQITEKFKMPTKSTFDQEFSMKEFQISSDDQALLDDIEEWKENYTPPSIESKTSEESPVDDSLSCLTNKQTLLGETLNDKVSECSKKPDAEKSAEELNAEVGSVKPSAVRGHTCTEASPDTHLKNNLKNVLKHRMKCCEELNETQKSSDGSVSCNNEEGTSSSDKLTGTSKLVQTGSEYFVVNDYPCTQMFDPNLSCEIVSVSIHEVTDMDDETEHGNIFQGTQPFDPNLSNEKPCTQPFDPNLSNEKPCTQPFDPNLSNEKPSTQPFDPNLSNEKPSTQPFYPNLSNENPGTQPLDPNLSNENQKSAAFNSNSVSENTHPLDLSKAVVDDEAAEMLLEHSNKKNLTSGKIGTPVAESCAKKRVKDLSKHNKIIHLCSPKRRKLSQGDCDVQMCDADTEDQSENDKSLLTSDETIMSGSAMVTSTPFSSGAECKSREAENQIVSEDEGLHVKDTDYPTDTKLGNSSGNKSLSTASRKSSFFRNFIDKISIWKKAGKDDQCPENEECDSNNKNSSSFSDDLSPSLISAPNEGYTEVDLNCESDLSTTRSPVKHQDIEIITLSSSESSQSSSQKSNGELMLDYKKTSEESDNFIEVSSDSLGEGTSSMIKPTTNNRMRSNPVDISLKKNIKKKKSVNVPVDQQSKLCRTKETGNIVCNARGKSQSSRHVSPGSASPAAETQSKGERSTIEVDIGPIENSLPSYQQINSQQRHSSKSSEEREKLLESLESVGTVSDVGKKLMNLHFPQTLREHMSKYFTEERD